MNQAIKMTCGSYLLRIESVQTCMQGAQTVKAMKSSYVMSSHYRYLFL